MSTINGGPAFPFYAGEECFGPGMSLRDYFAAKALVGLLAQSCGVAMGSDTALGAAWAYQMADAMLAARSPSQDTAK